MISHRRTALIMSGFICSCFAAGYGCGSMLAPREAQLAAITAGCKVSLDLDAGTADHADMKRGCEAALRALDPVKPDGGEAGAP